MFATHAGSPAGFTFARADTPVVLTTRLGHLYERAVLVAYLPIGQRCGEAGVD
jgi:hypothetical protein